MAEEVFAGVDVGASRTKVALLNKDKEVLGCAVRKSGTDFARTSELALGEALEMAGVRKEDITFSVATGYGRKNVIYADDTRTEIGCHAKGAFHFFPMAITVIDIGGQDNKIIKLDERGRRLSFKMNRKCAAGTGAFLEEMAMRLDIPLEEMEGLARQAVETVELGSFCTVFSATEVLEKIRQGKKVPDIVKGLFLSVIKRVLEMDSLTERVVMTGGVVEYNPYLVVMMRERTGLEIMVPERPQLTGAIGAALYGMEEVAEAAAA
ncbi:MAG TPA: ATPase [Desulfobacteraceae bacterium]|nr:ATPase [Deltaproteobacteria bacterium]HDM10782.1 ATPase [Desulfobacteraceae bacterium]